MHCAAAMLLYLLLNKSRITASSKHLLLTPAKDTAGTCHADIICAAFKHMMRGSDKGKGARKDPQHAWKLFADGWKVKSGHIPGWTSDQHAGTRETP